MMRLDELVRRLGGRVVAPRARGLAAACLVGGGPDAGRAQDRAEHEAAPLVADVRVDSRTVRPNELFAALPGTRDDGRRHALDAAARGAVAVLADAPIEGLDVAQWIHDEPRRTAGRAAALVHGEPARGQFTVAITGTNGKTTTAHLAGHLLRHVGMRPAVLGTTGHRLAGGEVASTHTTPDAPELQRLLARHRRAGGDAAALEVSSHALDQERIAGLAPSVAVFTNLTRDHLDYHGTFERYRAAKALLFESLGKDATAVVNADDPSGSFMADAARRAGASVVTYSIGSRADLCASRLRTDLKGTNLFVSGMGITLTRLWLPLAGRYNVENALAALAAVLVSGASPSNV
jgi:UDP-N-acetylmuramoyl-L-alanyl-D-glutamate--2,6-diaminopimelate ligase